jgi:hypothetical protein
MIETRAESVIAAQAAIPAEPCQPLGRRRTRSAAPVVEEPLVQVETQK